MFVFRTGMHKQELPYRQKIRQYNSFDLCIQVLIVVISKIRESPYMADRCEFPGKAVSKSEYIPQHKPGFAMGSDSF